MPIGDCGFPAVSVSHTPPAEPAIVLGSDELARRGPTIAIEVGFEASLFGPDPVQQLATAAILARNPGAPGTFEAVHALVDTGATESCIDEDLAVELQLPLIDNVMCSGVGGRHTLNVYLGHIRIPSISQIEYGRFIGAKLRDGDQPHSALLGRTLLKKMIFIYDGRTGAATLSV